MIEDRLLVLAGALFGAAGIGLLAASAHGTMPTLSYAAEMLLTHAGALVAIAAAIEARLLAPRPARIAGVGLIAGVALFSADIAWRAVGGERLFPMAAPAGGVVAIAAWLLVAAAALWSLRRRQA